MKVVCAIIIVVHVICEGGRQVAQKNALKLKSYKRKSARGAHKFPTIAQLVERPTVVDKSQPSDGPWFESGLSDLFYWPCVRLPPHPLNLKLDLIKSLESLHLFRTEQLLIKVQIGTWKDLPNFHKLINERLNSSLFKI